MFLGHTLGQYTTEQAVGKNIHGKLYPITKVLKQLIIEQMPGIFMFKQILLMIDTNQREFFLCHYNDAIRIIVPATVGEEVFLWYLYQD